MIATTLHCSGTDCVLISPVNHGCAPGSPAFGPRSSAPDNIGTAAVTIKEVKRMWGVTVVNNNYNIPELSKRHFTRGSEDFKGCGVEWSKMRGA